jgi:methionine sulfoxide reductase heme-binding subunit
VLMSGLFIWLMAHRAMHALFAQPDWPHRLALAAIAALLTAFGEMLWYALATGIDPWRVLAANLDPLLRIRPALWVLATGLGVAALGAIRARSVLRPAAAD